MNYRGTDRLSSTRATASESLAIAVASPRRPRLRLAFRRRHGCRAQASGEKLLEKYADVPMSFADACLVRMTETLQIIPCVLPR
jgi:hypothetical protein